MTTHPPIHVTLLPFPFCGQPANLLTSQISGVSCLPACSNEECLLRPETVTYYDTQEEAPSDEDSHFGHGEELRGSSPAPAPACSEIPVVEEALWVKIHDTVKYSIAIFNSQPHFVVNGIMNTIRPYLHSPEPVSVAAGAEAVKAVLDLSLVGPDTGFKAEDVARAIAKAGGLKYVD